MTCVRILIAAVLIVGCRDDRLTVEPRGMAGSAWVRIEELARPEGEPKAHEQLSRAMREQSVDALIAWHTAGGGLVPPNVAPREDMLATKQMVDVGALAIAARDGFAAGVHLGNRMVTQGRTSLEVMSGISLLRSAKAKARVARVPAPSELVRIAAAEALFSRRMDEYARTPQGQADTPPMPAGTDWGALEKFWLAALDGAKRGEPAATTLDRMRAAHAKGEGTAVQELTSHIVNVFERIGEDLEALQ